jgi:SAM-dependent methyltransferase
VEIASNDGYLLKNFQAAGIPCLGIEPAQNIAKVAREMGIETLTEFFGKSLAEELAGANRSADLILGNNVFAHAPDTNDFVAGLERLLKPKGVIALEFPYAVDFVTRCEFDTIYHEHVFYFSLTALMPLFQRHGLEIFRVERLSIHGGSLRLFTAHAGAHAVNDSVAQLLEEEAQGGFNSLAPYEAMAGRALEIREQLRQLIGELKAAGKSVAAYGASAKGSTLLNYCNLGVAELDFIADRSAAKIGRLSPGQRIPIIAAEDLRENRPDYTLLLTWNFADEILAQQQAYRDAGGKFIIPIPDVRIA